MVSWQRLKQLVSVLTFSHSPNTKGIAALVSLHSLAEGTYSLLDEIKKKKISLDLKCWKQWAILRDAKGAMT